MYEGLREGLRAATKVVITTWENLGTDEVYFDVCRHERRLLRLSMTGQAAAACPQNIQAEMAWLRANQIVDSILAEVDWNTFF